MNLLEKIICGLTLGAAAFFGSGCDDDGGGGGETDYATEAEGDNELAARLQQYKDNGEIIDYGINEELDLGVDLVGSDYWVLFQDPRLSPPFDERYAIGWYQGENDDEHLDEKEICEDYDVPWAQINPCPYEEIAPKLDEIKDNGWENSGQVKSLEYPVDEKDFF